MQLIYRGHFYTYISTHTKQPSQLRAINWRYQIPVEG